MVAGWCRWCQKRNPTPNGLLNPCHGTMHQNLAPFITKDQLKELPEQNDESYFSNPEIL